MKFTNEQIYQMDCYLWLDYCIESIWVYYKINYGGRIFVDDEEEEHIAFLMECIYDFEANILEILNKHNISFSMLTQYKEMNNVSHWPTRYS